jgi:hypothetical protein
MYVSALIDTILINFIGDVIKPQLPVTLIGSFACTIILLPFSYQSWIEVYSFLLTLSLSLQLQVTFIDL